MRIKALSSVVANQIAAGEVIENPASVVKELLENALDAHANVITIEIGFGGLNHMKISDNGMGIDAEDLTLAIAPHATSKLIELNDLSTLTSMGFRGEALASIASISRLTLTSKPAKQAMAMRLEADGVTVQITPCARSNGTTIEVRDLFYNAPVRRRFMRSARSEAMAIEHVVKRFALSAPDIALRLHHNDKMLLDLPAVTNEHTQRHRIQKILGKSFVDEACFLDVERAGMRLTGWVSGEGFQRSQSDKQWFYLNQRMVKDKLMHHAFKQAYDNRLHPGRHPACLLYLSVPTADVDVNVHPTKHEVRFQQPRLVHDFIGGSVLDALAVAASGSSDHASATDFESHDPHLAMVLRDDHPQCTKRFDAPVTGHQTRPWSLVSPKFGMLSWNGEVYLFNIRQALHARCLEELHHAERPLASRPLLVPVRENCSEEAGILLRRWQPILQEWGIHLDINPSFILVRSIPVLFPQLDIQHIVQGLITQAIDTEDALRQLFLVPPPCNQLSSTDKEAIGDYLIQHLEKNTEPREWCVPLTDVRCEALMHA